MVPLVIHANHRGTFFSAYDDDMPAFGFSSRAAYALGMDKPHYPVPAIMDNHMVLARDWPLYNLRNLASWWQWADDVRKECN